MKIVSIFSQCNDRISNEPFVYANRTKSTSDIIDDLFLVIQNLVAGIGFVSSRILSDNCLECKIHLSSNFPVITLQYKSDFDYSVQHDPQFEPHHGYEKKDESGRDKILKENNEHNSCDFKPLDAKENDVSLPVNVKQEIPEVLAVLNSSEEVREEQSKQYISFQCVQENQMQLNFAPIYIWAKPNILNYSQPSIGVYTQSEPFEKFSSTFIPKALGEICNNITSDKNSKGNENNSSNKDVKGHTSKPNTLHKTYSCNYCGIRFIRKDLQERHEMKHTVKKPEYSCSICDKSFKTYREIRIHEKTHIGGKNYPCTLCEKAFKTKQNAKQHVKTHYREKRHSCRFCGKLKTKTVNRSDHDLINPESKL